MMKIGDLVSLKSFQPVINLKWADNENEQLNLLKNYILTEDLSELFTEVLETINMIRSPKRCESKGGDISRVDTLRSHVISGQYGTGKSYFLLMLSIILELNDSELAKELLSKVKEFPDLYYQLKHIVDNKKKNLVVRINGENENEKHFDDVIQAAVVNALNERFDDVVLKSNFQNLLESLIEHKDHEVRGQLLEKALESKNYDFNDLVNGLKGHSREARSRYQQVINEAKLSSGDDFKNLQEFLEDVNEFLNSKGYDELIIILDEFSAYLSASIEAKRSNLDLGNIQTLAQATAPTSGLNVSFITSTHMDMQAILSNALATEKEIEKVLGRFNQVIISFNQGNELIKDTIKVDSEKFGNLKQKHLTTITKLEEKYGYKVEDYYPLHPVTLNYIHSVSKRFAQADRTLFKFLREVIKEKFFNENIIVNDKLNLISLDMIFEYFLPSIEKDQNLIKAYNQMQEIADNELEEKINKALVVSYISLLSSSSGAKKRAGLSEEDLAEIYLVTEQNRLGKSLNNLMNDNRSQIVFNDGGYQLIVSNTGINIDQELSKEAQNINPYSQLRTLLVEEENTIDIRKSYDLKYNKGLYPLGRSVEGKLTNLSDLNKIKGLKRYFMTNSDAKVVFIIPDFNENYNMEDLKSKYKEEMKSLPANVSLALPKKIYFDEKSLKEYGAVKRLENNDKIIDNENLSQLLAQRKRKIESKIRNRFLRRFARVNNFVFVFNQGIVKEKIRNDKELFQELLYRYYEKFPLEITVENFDSRSSSNPVIDNMIENGQDLVSKKSNSIYQKQIFNTLKPLDLVKIEEQPENYKVTLKVPSEENSKRSYDIWDIIADESLSIKDKFTTLKSAPYGLNDPLMEMYIGIAIALDKFRLKDKSGKVIVSPNKDHIVDIENSNYILESVPEPDVRKKEQVKEIWQVLSKFIANSHHHSYDPRGKRNDNKVFATLASEIKSVVNNFNTYQDIMNNWGLDTTRVDSIKNALSKVITSKRPEELYDRLVGLVNQEFSQDNYNSNLKEFEDFINNLYKFINNQKDKVSDIKMKLRNLENKIKPLKAYSDLKNRLEKVNKFWEEYSQKPFDFDKLEDLESEAKLLIATYNQTYKRVHDEYYEEYKEAKEDILIEQKQHIELIKSFEKIEFDRITKIKGYIEDLKEFKLCDELKINENQIAECSCSLSNIQIVEDKLEAIESDLKPKKRQIANIYVKYIDELKKINTDISDYIEDKEKEKLEDWKFIIAAINDDAIAYKEELVARLDKVVSLINSYLEDDEEDIGEGCVIDECRVELDEFITYFERNAKASGLRKLSFDEVKSIFQELCRDLADKKECVGLEIKE
ncbi:DUF6079 family protein [Orenia marismortui]|uniref:Uncharacterized protein n=1 Tax=Orenia marismortui TaxID=46469 RepID=A0A4R8H6N2_9FIRM|nr:DUF6079 family protein [Orenia marismortui]TDX53236.1 hypothetical protein C7959_10388 [Orenia marismortui]